MSRPRLVFIVICLTLVLIATVHLRTSSSRVFYHFRSEYVKHNRLKRQVWKKQIEMETITNPASLGDIIEE